MHKRPQRVALEARRQVIARDLSKCQWCGRHVRTESGWYSLQHRRARGMGGSRARETDRAGNLVLVCGTGTTECHGWIEAHPAEAAARGFRIAAGARPDRVALVDWTGRAWLLDDGGGKEPAPPAGLGAPESPLAYSAPPLINSPTEAGRAVLEALARSQPR
ncbi:HNH endonuclease [Arthrobacter phage Galaxy]|uniref:HNH endonuclease n=1 Tax=Arthrobacter phage Galaxy TaxID=1772326 RepID=A0A0U4IKC7_9CAUD|nr:HNH endonuclease [Arthrobacter phage Galaxy]ALY08874.1 HNH endonuclease [Arthrobacter phage Galaxy]